MHIDTLSASLVEFGNTGNGLFQNVTVNEMNLDSGEAVITSLPNSFITADWLILDNVHMKVRLLVCISLYDAFRTQV